VTWALHLRVLCILDGLCVCCLRGVSGLRLRGLRGSFVLVAFAVVLYRCRGDSFCCGRGEGWIGRGTILMVEYLPALLKRVRFSSRKTLA
jgi:hypothetical protein